LKMRIRGHGAFFATYFNIPCFSICVPSQLYIGFDTHLKNVVSIHIR
jgi:hypothetical protein